MLDGRKGARTGAPRGGIQMATINGTEGPDNLGGTSSGDTISGLGGNDLIGGFEGNDTLRGGNGDDVIVGGVGADLIEGNDGADVLGDNDIFLSGGVASAIPDLQRDDIRGGNGNDSLSGGVSDVFDGGAGIDIAIISYTNIGGASVDLRPLNTGGVGTLASGGTIRNVEGGIAKTIATNWLIWLLFAFGVSPERLARLYRHIR